MTVAMEQVCKEALELPPDQRLALVYRILEQSDACLDSAEAQREWDGALRRRAGEFAPGGGWDFTRHDK